MGEKEEVRKWTKFKGILPKKKRQMFTSWLNGWSLDWIAKEHGVSRPALMHFISFCIERIDIFCYNRQQYMKHYSDLIDIYKRNRLKFCPKWKIENKYDINWREYLLFEAWKLRGYKNETIKRMFDIKEDTYRHLKMKVRSKLGLRKFDRDYCRKPNNSRYIAGIHSTEFLEDEGSEETKEEA